MNNAQPAIAVSAHDIPIAQSPGIKGPGQSVPVNGLKKFSQWKQEIMEQLINDDVLMKLIKYPEEDYLNKPSVPMNVREKMIGENIFPYRFINNIPEKRTSIISMEFSHWQPYEGFRIFSERFIHGYIYFYILSDVNILKTDYGVRTDEIQARIYEIFEGYRNLGVGEMKQETQLPLWPDNSSYGGYQLGFMVTEFK